MAHNYFCRTACPVLVPSYIMQIGMMRTQCQVQQPVPAPNMEVTHARVALHAQYVHFILVPLTSFRVWSLFSITKENKGDAGAYKVHHEKQAKCTDTDLSECMPGMKFFMFGSRSKLC